MVRFYIRIIVAMMLFSVIATSANADSVRKLKHQTFYGDAQGYFPLDYATRTVDYLYDGQNRLIRAVENSISSDYDEAQRTWETTHYDKYEYDANNNLTETTSLTYGLFDYGEWGYNASKDTVTYEYNDLNQCIRETHKYVIYEYTYDEQGRKLTSSKWNIGSVSGKKSNDLIETYSDFNAQCNPCTITATSPTGKSWNEYTGTIEYDENGNKICEKHISKEDNWMTFHEEWTYDGDFLTEHIQYNVLEGQDQGGTKEIYTAVDGNKDKVMRNTYGSDTEGGWTERFGGTDCLYEYDYYDGATYSPTLTAAVSEEGINNVVLTFTLSDKACYGNYVTVYRNGLAVLEDVYLNGLVVSYEDNKPVCRIYDDTVKNGFYEYVVLIKEMKGQDEDGDNILNAVNASNVAAINVYTELPCATDLHVVSIRKDFSNNTYVTIGWTNPTYDKALGFKNTHLFFKDMQTQEAETLDPTVNQLEANFGPETEKTLYVQTNYVYGRANSQNLTVKLSDYTGIEEVKSQESRVKSQELYNTLGQRVNEGTRGIIIKDGKKYLNK